MNARRKLIRAAEEEASKFGASISSHLGGKHLIITVTLGGEYRKFTSNNKAAKLDHQIDWAKQNVRRIVKEIQCKLITGEGCAYKVD